MGYLGYASTIHAAQGATIDTTHTLLAGTETRQLLYVAMTRGRQANHAYVTTVGDGNPHSAFVPETLRPPTAVEIVEAILARDGASRSVSTELAHADDPALRLADAVNRYRDALTVALEQHHAHNLDTLDREADTVVPGLTDCDAWPTLRQRLLTTADTRPLDELRRVAAGHRFDDIHDPAALLASLIPEPTGGPLPWLPRIPTNLATDDRWGPYLEARAQRVTGLANRVREEAQQSVSPPDWMPVKDHVPERLIGDVAVWRAAMGVDPADRRPTGERVFAGAAPRHQDQLDRQLLAAVPTLGVAQLRKLGQGLESDPGTGALARQLAQLEALGIPVAVLLATALTEGPLPAERPAAALQWRIHQLEKQQPTPVDAESRWRAWADAINPALTDSPQWPTIRGLLTNLPESIDAGSLTNELQGRSSQEVRATLMRLGAAAHGPSQARPSLGQERWQAAPRKPPRGIPR